MSGHTRNRRTAQPRHQSNTRGALLLGLALLGVSVKGAKAQDYNYYLSHLNSITAPTGATVTLQTQLLPRSGRSAPPIQGMKIEFYLETTNQASVLIGTATTNSNGWATLTYTIPESVGTGYKTLEADMVKYHSVNTTNTFTIPLVIDTDLLTVGNSKNDFYGVPMQTMVDSSGIAHFYVKGDIHIPAGPVTPFGSHPLSLVAANNVTIDHGVTLQASANGIDAILGGGMSGAGGEGVAGGIGGAGGRHGNGGNGGGEGTGAPATRNGIQGTHGGNGGNSVGNVGLVGKIGGDGFNALHTGGTPGNGGAITKRNFYPGDTDPGQGGTGGAYGDGGWGKQQHIDTPTGGIGGSGGNHGLNGQTGNNGLPGLGGHRFNAGLNLSAGGAGGGGGSASSGSGGGGGGAGGGAGGGGGNYNAYGASGGNGGDGGQGGLGGSGGAGGAGGAGGGAFEILARGRILVAGQLLAQGGAGQAGFKGSLPLFGMFGVSGAAGSDKQWPSYGGSGGSIGTDGTAGGNGDNAGTDLEGASGGGGGGGAMGGYGANGGIGGDGGGGAGGTVKLFASVVLGKDADGNLAEIDTNGGASNSNKIGDIGRVVLGMNNSDPFEGTIPYGQFSSYAGTVIANPFVFQNPSTPVIPDLVGGAEGFGLLAIDATALPDLIANAPKGAVGALVLMEKGPEQYGVSYTHSEMLLCVNLSLHSLIQPAIGVGANKMLAALLKGGVDNCHFFANDPGAQTLQRLEPQQIYATLISMQVDTFNFGAYANGSNQPTVVVGAKRANFTLIHNAAGEPIYRAYYLMP